MGPTLGFDRKQRNSFFIKFGVFDNKNKILTILFIVYYGEADSHIRGISYKQILI